MPATEAMTDTARVGTGVPGLDALLAGGFPAGRSVLVCGGPGTGKTTMATQFLAEGLARGEPGVLVSVDQKPRHVLEDYGGFPWSLAEAVGRRQLALLDASPYFTVAGDPRRRLEARQLAADLARQVHEVRARRLAIDSVTSLVPDDVPGEQARAFLRSLFFSIEDNLGCTALLTSGHDGSGFGAMVGRLAESLASGVVELRLVGREGRFQRRLFVRKMRGTATDLVERPFEIADRRGLVLADG